MMCMTTPIMMFMFMMMISMIATRAMPHFVMMLPCHVTMTVLGCPES